MIELKLKVENGKVWKEKVRNLGLKEGYFRIDGNKKWIRRINRINRIGINNNDVFNEYHFY